MTRKTAAYTKDPELPVYGPTWHDVHDMIKQVATITGLKPEIVTRQITSVDNKLGLYCTLTLDGHKVQGAGCGFGPAYPSSPKTFPAAAYHLLTVVYHRWEDDGPDATQAFLARATGDPF